MPPGRPALRDVAHFYGIHFNLRPRPDDPISIRRAEFAGLVEGLRNAGVPVKIDLDRAWRAYAGWRSASTRPSSACALVGATPLRGRAIGHRSSTGLRSSGGRNRALNG